LGGTLFTAKILAACIDGLRDDNLPRLDPLKYRIVVPERPVIMFRNLSEQTGGEGK
jgi:hypothetical protein